MCCFQVLLVNYPKFGGFLQIFPSLHPFSVRPRTLAPSALFNWPRWTLRRRTADIPVVHRSPPPPSATSFSPSPSSSSQQVTVNPSLSQQNPTLGTRPPPVPPHPCLCSGCHLLCPWPRLHHRAYAEPPRSRLAVAPPPAILPLLYLSLSFFSFHGSTRSATFDRQEEVETSTWRLRWPDSRM